MIIFKKAELCDVNRVAIAIMQLKSTDTNVTESEVMALIDHCYYAYDDNLDTIVALVAAEREVLTETSQVSGQIETVYPNRYFIRYIVADDYIIEEMNKDLTVYSVLNYLIRELVGDMNDWSVWVNVNDVLTQNNEAFNDALLKALRSNYFAAHINNHDNYIRVMPIDFDSLH